MTDEQILEIAGEQTPYDLTSEEAEFCINFAHALLSASIADTAGAKPVAWMTVSDGYIFYGSARPDRVCEECVPLYLHPSAELTALRERIAGIRMEALKEARHVVYMSVSLNDAFTSIDALVDKEKA